MASPGKSTALFTFTAMSTSLPCSTLAALNARVTNCSATVSLANCERDRDRGPSGVSAVAVDDDLPGPQLGAVVGVDRDQGLVLLLGDRRRRSRADARRVPGQGDRDRRGEPRLPLRDDLQRHRPAPDERHLGLDDLDRERGLLGHGDGERVDRPGPERDVVLPEDQLDDLTRTRRGRRPSGRPACPRPWPGSRRPGRRPRPRRGRGSSSCWRPSCRPRTSPRREGPRRPTSRSPPKSARVALTRIAWRFPFGTATAIGRRPARDRLVGRAQRELRRRPG